MSQIGPEPTSLTIRQFIKPTASCSIVMCTRVHHCIRGVIMREMDVIRAAIEGELQDARSRDVELVAKSRHVRCNYAEVLGDERQCTQRATYRPEETGARTGHPFAGLRSRCPRRYVPGGRERPEMIQANDIYVGQQGAYAIDAPGIAGAAKSLPVVDRVVPELPRGAKIIGWDTGYKARPVVLVQLKQLRVGPYIARI